MLVGDFKGGKATILQVLDLQRKNCVAFGQHPIDRFCGLRVNVWHLCNTLVVGVYFLFLSKFYMGTKVIDTEEGWAEVPIFFFYFVDMGDYPPRIRGPILFSGGTLTFPCQVKSFRV